MAYVPNPTDATQPVESVFAKTAAAEFRALKAYVQSIVSGGGVGAPTPGQIVAFAYASAPPGWLALDGSVQLRSTFANLWALVNTIGSPVSEAVWAATNNQSFSVGDGATTFRLPDYRGIFLRGLDSGAGRDPGRVLGAGQADAFQGHGHVVFTMNQIAGATQNNYQIVAPVTALTGSYAGATVFEAGAASVNTGSGVPRIATETRPQNGAALYCIKT